MRVRPLTTSASTTIQGAWQTSDTGPPAAEHSYRAWSEPPTPNRRPKVVMPSRVGSIRMTGVGLAILVGAACQAGSPKEEAEGHIHCSNAPVAQARPDVQAVAFARGEGPVYISLGTAGVVHYTEDNREHAGWYYHKSLWAVSPDYDGPVTVTGRQANGPKILRFNPAEEFPGQPRTSLRFPAEQDASGWRFGPSDTLIGAPGCYVFEIMGEDLLQRITFRARP
jgi:hypothetical protein